MKQKSLLPKLFSMFLTLSLLTLPSLSTPTQVSADGFPERISVASNGTQANNFSFHPSTSADGRYIAFASNATNLVEDDTNNYRDIFVRDRQTGITERVSVAFNGNQANSLSDNPSISDDGRYVAFQSPATNLVPEDTNATIDIFIRDMQMGTTERINTSTNNAQANDYSEYPSISADGRFVAFDSLASNLVEDDTNNYRDIFVHDRQTGITERVSVSSNGIQGNNGSITKSISADGRFVAFSSLASNLAINDSHYYDTDIFVHDRQTGTTEYLSSDNNPSIYPSISSDGRYVAFVSNDIFVYDRQTGAKYRVSNNAYDTSISDPSISADGRYIAFVSNGNSFFVHDRQTGITEGYGAGLNPSISADGKFIAFTSDTSNLVPDDTNNTYDIFITTNPPPSSTPTPSCGMSPSGLNTCDLQKGDILLSHSDNALAFAEAALFNGYWTHAGIYNGDGTITESYPDTPAETPGVVVRPQSESLFWNPDITDWYVLRTNTSNDADIDNAVNYARESKNKLYNYIFPDKFTEDKFYCSQLVWRSFYDQGIDLDSNKSGFSTFTKHWLTPLGLIGGAAVLAAVPPDDIFYSQNVDTLLDKPVDKRLVFRVHSPARLLITDPSGRQTGFDPITNSAVQEIPGTFYGGLDSDPQFATITGDINENWLFQVIGTGDGAYTFTAEGVDREEQILIPVQGSTTPDKTDTYQLASTNNQSEPINIQRQIHIKVIPHEIYPTAGLFAVSILGEDNFSTNDINIESIKVGTGNALPLNNKGFIIDTNKDNIKDLITFYRSRQTGIAAGDTQICLSGQTKAGQNFKGCGSIEIKTKPLTIFQILKLITINDQNTLSKIQQFLNNIKE